MSGERVIIGVDYGVGPSFAVASIFKDGRFVGSYKLRVAGARELRLRVSPEMRATWARFQALLKHIGGAA